MENWLHGHMAAILLGIEILWVGGVIAIIVFYFLVKRRFSRAARPSGTALSDEHPSSAHGKDESQAADRKPTHK